MKQRLYILVGILLVLGVMITLWWYQAVKPVNPTDSQLSTFSVKRSEGARSIAERLQKQGFIRSPVAFFIFVRFGGISDNIQAGQFLLSPSMNMKTVAVNLTHGTIDVRIMIPEGWRKEEIALKLAQELGIPENEFNRVAKEGYMFPDTYLFPKDATPSAIADILFATFKKRVTESDMSLAKQKNLSLDDLVTISSLIEREARLEEDRPLIASVILNRLKLGMKLDIDASVQYALGYQTKERTWWKKELTQEDLEVDSLYNTYKNAGLPPTPIANPGIAAIRAVLNAPETDYLYYIADKQGKSHFAKTIEEHDANIAKFLNK